MLEGTTFLVTGATGRIGVELARRIEDLGAACLPLVFGGYPDQPKRTAWSARTKPIRIAGPDDLQDVFHPDHVINCHWEVDRGLSFTEQLIFEIKSNLHSPAYLWDWLSQGELRSFVNVSSIKIFSPLNKNPISSATEPRPGTPYGIAKLAAEKFFDAHFHDSNIPVMHLRLCSVMAAGGHPSQLTSQLISSLFQNKRIRINRGRLTYFLYIDEVVDLIIKAALEARSGRYNLTSTGIPNERISELFGRIAGREVDAEYVDFDPTVTDPVFVSDIDRFQASWVRRTSLEQAIDKIIKTSA